MTDLNLAQYDTAWPARYEDEAVRIAEVLGELALVIEHVGSTSVLGMLAKPVIDIAIAVDGPHSADACVSRLELLDYVHRGPHGDDARRRYFVRDVDGQRFAHIHLYELPARAYHEKLAFRDALRTDPALAIAYAAEKLRIAEEVGWNKLAYSLGKDPFIKDVLERLMPLAPVAERAPAVFVGVDVQVRRGCPFYAIDGAGSCKASGWMRATGTAPLRIRALLDLLSKGVPGAIAIGIDAPRMPLDARREWSWSGKQGAWSPAPNAKGLGRHCEVVISAQRLANPQWTPLRDTAPEWMRLGFSLFDALRDFPQVFEVFPSAAYRQLHDDPHATLQLDFRECLPGPKDMLDAAMGAFVVREFMAGRGCEVGGGDGLGTIVLPRPLHARHAELARWPGSRRNA